jgi:ABC-2 type transport system permease protein
MSAGPQTQVSFSPYRVGALVLRYWYLLRSSWPRLLELIYWPMVQVLTWGLIQVYVAQHSGFFARAGATLIGAMLLWEILFRGQLGFSVSFLEEMWARNIGNLFMSPLRPAEFVAALMVMSLVRLIIGMVPVFLAATFLFDFQVSGLGFAFVFFFVNLILTSWAIGICVSGLLLRYGLGAESLAWTLAFVILPISCVYYPVSVLPEWLQPLSWLLPPTYVFEGLRALVIDGVFRADLMLSALGLNAIYFSAAAFAFLRLLQSARREGTLMQTGE